MIAAYALSEIFEKLKQNSLKFIMALFVLGTAVFQCTVTTQPRRFPNYEQLLIQKTRSLRSEYPNVTILSNNCMVAYALDVAPAGGPFFAPLTAKVYDRSSECFVLWDPFFSNSMFSQTKLTKERIEQDSSVTVLEKFRYWSAEYIVFHKKNI